MTVLLKKNVAMHFIGKTGAISKLSEGLKNPKDVSDCFNET
jgi:hypothetical protein